MTCIAYDGKTLAADKMAACGLTKSTVTKIFKWKSNLLGAAGTVSTCQDLIEWYKAGQIKPAFPDSARSEEFGATLLVVNKDGTWIFTNGPVPHRVEDKFVAIGCGDEAALVAMDCGKTAREAVEMASTWNTGCGNGVDTLTLA